MSEQTAQAGVRPEAVAAAAWWASRLGSATHNVGMGNVPEMELTVSLNAGTVRGSRTTAERERFRTALEAVIAEHLRDCPSCARGVVEHYLKVDYDPDALLSAAADRAGIDMHSRELPAKTCMIFREGDLIVSEGYGAPYVEVWRPS